MPSGNGFCHSRCACAEQKWEKDIPKLWKHALAAFPPLCSGLGKTLSCQRTAKTLATESCHRDTTMPRAQEHLHGGRAHTDTRMHMTGTLHPHNTFLIPTMLLTSTITLLSERQVGTERGNKYQSAGSAFPYTEYKPQL